ncbi:MAG: glycolate oxidase FAD binding subunit [Oceanospirillaceae bacterium]|jgi:glycolate oxidase FAD binding subunit
MSDINHHLVEAVKNAYESNTPLKIVAGNTKHFLGRTTDTSQELSLKQHRGVTSYQPVELVLTARAGTPITEIENVLAEHNQMLSFEPPNFSGAATIGGTLAANLSGPTRPWAGSVRDMVLGVQLINGMGELLNFGGQVMKNVAGYDLSRTQAGAMGALGVMTQISLKVLPKPEMQATLILAIGEAQAIVMMNKLAGTAKPIISACWHMGQLYVRLAGAAKSVSQSARQWSSQYGFTELEDSTQFWYCLAQYQHQSLQTDKPLWRFSIKSTAASLALSDSTLIDWAGAQRWVSGDFDPAQLQDLATAAKGSVSLWRGGDRHGEVNFPLPIAMQQLQQRLKRSMDPKNILNPGRLYSWL